MGNNIHSRKKRQTSHSHFKCFSFCTLFRIIFSEINKLSSTYPFPIICQTFLLKHVNNNLGTSTRMLEVKLLIIVSSILYVLYEFNCDLFPMVSEASNICHGTDKRN